MPSKVPSRQLVVDANIMRSAGGTAHPVSSKSRQTLNDILRICHHAIVNESLRREWTKHASRYAKKWWVAMSCRGKIDDATDSTAGIRFAKVKPKDRCIIEKDRMLVDIAYGSGKIIISMDNEILETLRRTDNKRFTTEIRWFNPCTAPDGYLERL